MTFYIANDIRGFYGKITDNQLPVHFRAAVTFSGVRHSTVAMDMYCFGHI